jgi:rubrerythrin
LKNEKDESVPNREGEKVWECGDCGHVHIGSEAPEDCPVCNVPKGFFKLHSASFI